MIATLSPFPTTTSKRQQQKQFNAYHLAAQLWASDLACRPDSLSRQALAWAEDALDVLWPYRTGGGGVRPGYEAALVVADNRLQIAKAIAAGDGLLYAIAIDDDDED